MSSLCTFPINCFGEIIFEIHQSHIIKNVLKTDDFITLTLKVYDLIFNVSRLKSSFECVVRTMLRGAFTSYWFRVQISRDNIVVVRIYTTLKHHRSSFTYIKLSSSSKCFIQFISSQSDSI